MPFPHGLIELADHAIGGVGLGRVDEVVILEKRADVGVGQWIILDRLLSHGIEAGGGDAVAGKRLAQVLQIGGGDGLRGVVGRIGEGGCGIVNRKHGAGRVEHIGVVAGTLSDGGDGLQIGAVDVLPHALVGERKVSVGVGVDEMWNHHGPGDIEAELIAAQEVFVAAVLADFVGYGIQNIIAEIFEKAAVPVLDGMAAALGGAVCAEPEVAGLDLELFDGAVHLGVGG